MFCPSEHPREGDLYKQITLANHTFELRFGYYEERERELCPPVVIFPDLVSQPVYDPLGHPLVTQIQEPCEHYRSIDCSCPEDWCGDCIHFESPHTELGICQCPHNQIDLRRNTL